MGNIVKNASTKLDEITAYQTGAESEFLAVLFNYPSTDVSEPIFHVGEKLRVISEEGGWWRAVSLKTGRENYIPGTCVAKVYHGWLFDGVGREKSEELLQLPDTKIGTFMIRQSETKKGSYSLSVKYRQIKHYRIFRLPNSWYYISPRLTFQCLEHLVNHYSENSDGLCCVLTTPCLTYQSVTHSESLESHAPPVVRRRRTFDWKSMKRVPLRVEDTRNTLETDDTFLSFGLRESIASYISLAGDEDFSMVYGDKKKTKRQSQVIAGVNNRLSFRAFTDDYSPVHT
ncbi:src-like-adapter [Spea bombifrons]|uniref:src-like-adapter n=1 Tax=Spea bombifrons TaxID=233779 RepID=UPI0023499191|nr:src-like-adapter [Spea bombifrons]